jgi:hypothetical protein
MNTYTTTATGFRARELVSSGTATARSSGAAALLLICGTLAVGAFFAFPLYDDGWMALMLREAGPHSLKTFMGDRPVFGVLLQTVARFGAANKFVFVSVDVVLWLAFAVEAGLLFQKLFPELRNYSIVASCLTLAPIVVQTQLCTALVVIPANLATILGYAALLFLLDSDGSEQSARPVRVGAAVFLASAGVAISEYGVATNLVGCAVLLGLALSCPAAAERRKLVWRATWLFGLTAIVYVAFAKTANFGQRPDVAPAHALHREVGKWVEIPFDVISGIWHSVVGAYASAFGGFNLAWDSKSTILGAFFGVLIAALFFLAVQNFEPRSWEEDSTPRPFARLIVLLAAIAVGLVPFSLMGRATTLGDFGSRFRIPVMPIAAAATLCLVLNFARRHFRWVAVVALGFIVGYASWTSAYTTVKTARSISSLQGVLKPYVKQTDGITVAAVPFERFETELTANVTSTWPVELEKKMWVIPTDAALQQFGGRLQCRPSNEINVHVRGLSRAGKLVQILWVDAQPGMPARVETYCQMSR